ncbi:hypothetical protein ACROYT_G021007 [Oculina patagonica]
MQRYHWSSRGNKGHLLNTKMNQAKFFAVLIAMCLVMGLFANSGNAESRGRRRREYRVGSKTGIKPNKEERGHGNAGAAGWEDQTRTGKRPNRKMGK